MGIFSSGRPSYQPPPSCMGIYRIIGPDGLIKYIGITIDLCRRSLEHMRAGGKMSFGDRFGWQAAKPETTYQQLRAYETIKIAQHDPPLNLCRGGGGRTPDIWGSLADVGSASEPELETNPTDLFEFNDSHNPPHPPARDPGIREFMGDIAVSVLTIVAVRILERGIEWVIDWLREKFFSEDAEPTKEVHTPIAPVIVLPPPLPILVM